MCRLLLVGRDALQTVRVVIVTSRLDSASGLDGDNTGKSSNTGDGAVVGLVRLTIRRCGHGARNLQIRREAAALLKSRQFGFGAVWIDAMKGTAHTHLGQGVGGGSRQ